MATKIAQMLQAVNWSDIKNDLDNISAQLELEQLAEIRRIKSEAKAKRIAVAIQNGRPLLSKKLK